MNTASVIHDIKPITLSTGLYDLLKDHLRKHKLSKYNEEKLALELRSAQQLLNKELPSNVVTVNKKVRVKLLHTGEEQVYNFVGTTKAKRKNNTTSILTPIGIATIGHTEGTELDWEMPEGVVTIKIEEVSDL